MGSFKTFFATTALFSALCLSSFGTTLAAILDSITPELLSTSSQDVKEEPQSSPRVIARRDIVPVSSEPAAARPQRLPLVLSAPAEEKKELKTPTNVNVYEVLTTLGRVLTEQFDINGQLKLLPLNKWRSVEVDASDYEITFAPFKFDEIRSSFSVAFTILSNDSEIGSWSIPVSCELWKNVYYTTERVQRGIGLDSSSVRIKTVNVLRLPHKALSQDAKLHLYETSHSISNDRPIFWNQITRKPDLRRGQIVEIIAEDGLMRISTKGIALENGLINDFISVRNTQSRRDIQAQVINEKKVKVHF